MSRIFVLAALPELEAPLDRFAQATPSASPEAAATPAGVTVVANRLNNPQGFTWSPDGSLYLAQAGVGGETEGLDRRAVRDFGGYTASVARIGHRLRSPDRRSLHRRLAEADTFGGSRRRLPRRSALCPDQCGPTGARLDDVSGVYRMGTTGRPNSSPTCRPGSKMSRRTSSPRLQLGWLTFRHGSGQRCAVGGRVGRGAVAAGHRRGDHWLPISR